MCLRIVYENKINHEVDRLLNDEYIVGYKEFQINHDKSTIIPYHKSKYRYKYNRIITKTNIKLLEAKFDNHWQEVRMYTPGVPHYDGNNHYCKMSLGYHIKTKRKFINDWWIPILYSEDRIQLISDPAIDEATVSKFLLMSPYMLEEYLIKKLIIDKTLYIDNSSGDNIYDQTFISDWISAYIIHYEKIFNKIWIKTKE